MSSLAANYFERTSEMLTWAWEENREVIAKAAAEIARSVAAGGVVHTFGSGHSEIIAREVVGRAGGLACVSAIVDPTAGFVENLPGYGQRLVERYDRQYELRRGEVLIVISNSGKNAAPIDVALYGRQKALTVVALTSLPMSRVTPSQHPGGKRLFECADLVLDNGGVPGDAIVEVQPGVSGGPTSTLIGCSLLNWLMLDAIDRLKAAGHAPPVLQSQNVAGAIEHNRELGRRYQGRLSRQLA